MRTNRQRIGFVSRWVAICIAVTAGCSQTDAPRRPDEAAGARVPYATSDGGLHTVDSLDPSRVEKVLARGLKGVFVQAGARMDRGAINGTRPYRLYYFTDGGWYSAELKAASALVPKRLVRQSGVCRGEGITLDYSKPDEMVLIYQTAGDDSQCFTSDDRFHGLRVLDGATFEVPSLPVGTQYETGLRLAHSIFREGAKLIRYDSSFRPVETVMEEVSGVVALLAQGDDGMVVQVGAGVYSITSAGTVAGPLHELAEGRCICFAPSSDGSYVYFMEANQDGLDEATLLRVKLDGSESAVEMYRTEGNIVYAPAAAESVVVYEKTGDQARLALVSKVASVEDEPVVLDEIPSGFISLSVSGSRIYYTVQETSPTGVGDTAKIAEEAEGVVASFPGSRWIGFRVHAEGGSPATVADVVRHAYLADGAGNIQVVEGGTESPVDAGFFEGAESVLLRGEGEGVPGIVIDGAQSDIVLFSVEANVLTRVTRTPGISEQLLRPKL